MVSCFARRKLPARRTAAFSRVQLARQGGATARAASAQSRGESDSFVSSPGTGVSSILMLDANGGKPHRLKLGLEALMAWLKPCPSTRMAARFGFQRGANPKGECLADLGRRDAGA